MLKLTSLACVCLFLTTGLLSAKETLVQDPDEFHAAVKNVGPGDEVHLANGTWEDVELVAVGEGTAEKPIVIRAQDPGKVLITGNSRLRVAGQHVHVSGFRFHGAWHKTALMEFRKDSKQDASDCQISDCEFVDCVNPPSEKYEFKYLSVYGKRNVVQRCRLSGKTNRGTTLVVWLVNNGGHHTIRENHFGARPELKKNGGETIRIGDSDTAHQSGNCIVERNLFVECNGEGEIVSNKSCDNIYRHNVFLRCSGALTLRHGHRCVVESNLFLGEKARGSGGVRVIGSDHRVINNRFEWLEGSDYRSGLCVMNGVKDGPANGYQPVERLVVANNTFVDCKRCLLIGADNDEKNQVAPGNCLFANNAIHSRRGPLIKVETKPGNLVWLGNVCSGEGDIGVEGQSGLQRSDTDLLQKSDGRWRVFEGSSLVNAGKPHRDVPKTDFSDSPRDDQPDVGCDEWPLKSAKWMDRKVGPSWSPIALAR